MFDSDGPPVAPRDAASVILVRDGNRGAEVFLLRRHGKSSFMGSAFVFPGGAADKGESDARVTAARELFEEAGVLLANREIPAARLKAWRRRVQDEGASLTELMSSDELSFDVDSMVEFAHWVTPSAEAKRFSARFYVARLPAGQSPSFDNRETVDECWVTPADALARAGELRLPPPQLRTFHELAPVAERGVDAVLELARERAEHTHPILPRLCPQDTGFTLLLPWDPEYLGSGTGEAIEMPADHPLAVGPSRFVLEEMTWRHIHAPSSPAPE
jgi:8-oxo-dGTP pyrophosphatase MutT (NUDIX family)